MMFVPTDDVNKRFIVDQKFSDGLWYLWESVETSFGMDYKKEAKSGDENTILCELARRMRDG